ncbi:NUDIX hydrolase [Arthrobacter sp. W4I7]|jgi:8-oxo-dGTP pyrophosphatase MutT (NUDIX family)|uniref:NUDIX domain-containing protein n=1 Tax=Arthrobacter sp. W4I7 TaxID=3042296 RepID=UPI00278502C4|nr:NUDIX hydrolase [Arthrobacter sp. W4I7]MDQ0691667.1 8-oxo-dGTP pyrophosphatase MutT (NUDIX family) [Arthrobacter sp. W4I7]
MPGTHEATHVVKVSDAPSPRRLLSTEKVYEGRIWDVVSDTFQLQDSGEALTRDYIDHPGAVAILPMNNDGEILLLKQYRHPVGMDLWEIPAGLLDVEGEEFQAGAARELAEEADLAAGTWNVLADVFNSPGSSSEAIRIYLARDLTEVPHHERHERTDEEAEIEFHWINLDDAVESVLAGRLHNPSAVVGILAAAAARADGFAGLRPADAPWPEHHSQR